MLATVKSQAQRPVESATARSFCMNGICKVLDPLSCVKNANPMEVKVNAALWNAFQAIAVLHMSSRNDLMQGHRQGALRRELMFAQPGTPGQVIACVVDPMVVPALQPPDILLNAQKP